MMAKWLAIGLVILLSSGAATAGILEGYVEEGLQNNLALKQVDFSLEKSRAELREARGLFFPSVGINARYSRAGGGRSIDIPVGDLVNPIHETLNELLGEPRFPGNIANETTDFLREEEHETTLEVVQPIFRPDIYYNYKVKSNLASAQEAAREVFRQDLVLEIKTAYFNLLKAAEFVRVTERTRELLTENLRVSRSLFENDKVTRDVVYRAQAELSESEQQTAEAEKGRDLAKAYFNFLLNRPLDTSVEIEFPQDLPPEPGVDVSALHEQALVKRYEPVQLRRGVAAAENGVRLSRSSYLPSILLAFDYGYEGEIYRFGEDDDFWMGSLVLQWNLFSGLQRRARVGQAKAEERRLKARLDQLEQAIGLEVREARENMVVARRAFEAATDRLESAARSFEIVSRRYREGMAAHIEFLDARVAMTRSEVNLVVTRFDYHIRYAEYERALGHTGSGGV